MINSLTLFVAILTSNYALGKICAVYDLGGEKLLGGNHPHTMGFLGMNTGTNTTLPGSIRFENLRPKLLRSGNCKTEHVKMEFQSGVLLFSLTEKLSVVVGNTDDECTFLLDVEKDEGCPPITPEFYTFKYLIRETVTRPPTFSRAVYTFKMAFPIPTGTSLCKLNDIQMMVINLDFSNCSLRLELKKPFDGLEVMKYKINGTKEYQVELKTSKLLYLQQETILTLVASCNCSESESPSSEAHIRLQPNKNSVLPRPEFERNFYNVTLHAFQLKNLLGKEVYPENSIRLKRNFSYLDFGLRSITDNDLSFELVQKNGGSVNVRLARIPKGSLMSKRVLLQLTAVIGSSFGHKVEGHALLYVKIVDNHNVIKCDIVSSSAIFESDNKEHLTTAVIILGVVLVLMIFIIIFIYFKYIGIGKQKAGFVCEKCFNQIDRIKHRRPTPRRISEFHYPSDLMPPPLETLPETEVEEEGDSKEVLRKTTNETDKETSMSAKVSGEEKVGPSKTRKRSMTFREKDDESRQNRESVENVSKESSENKEKQRRKSSAHTYRCLLQNT